uniref:Uncharacterized protein n=1 Tax=Nomascus leucogenys TaxID=61853 RepID=A0A2I3G2K8_NOMLE
MWTEIFIFCLRIYEVYHIRGLKQGVYFVILKLFCIWINTKYPSGLFFFFFNLCIHLILLCIPSKQKNLLCHLHYVNYRLKICHFMSHFHLCSPPNRPPCSPQILSTERLANLINREVIVTHLNWPQIKLHPLQN